MKNTEVANDKTSEYTDNITELKEKIRQLEKELKRERLRADVYDEFINVAEENFKIQIRKKMTPNIRPPACSGLEGIAIEPMCELFGVSKQAYYKYDGSTAIRKAVQRELVIQHIKQIRGLTQA